MRPPANEEKSVFESLLECLDVIHIKNMFGFIAGMSNSTFCPDQNQYEYSPTDRYHYYF